MFGSKKKEKEFKHSVGYDPIKFMNTWTSINPSYGCIWDCGYCVQEKDSWYVGNGVVKEYSPQMTIDMIVGHSMITKEQPLAMYNFSDPFLPQNQKDLVEILKGLEKKKYHNIVGLITKTLPEKSTLKAIKKLRRLRPVVIVSYANLPDGIERAPAKNRVELIKRSSDMGIPTLVYMRPLVKEWVTEKSVEQFAKQVTPYADGIIISGLMYTNEIKDKLEGRRSEMRRRLKKPFEMPSVSPNGAKHLDY
ncbi:MAG: radical SAM protein, partial [Nanoarchaeota archaeon]|nr:radical SAM protein [Nanoarchaeota archaeon]